MLVTRDVTERPEGVAAGVVKLVGTNDQHVLTEARRLLDDQDAYQAMARDAAVRCHTWYGDGRAGLRIAAALTARTPRGPRFVHGGPQRRAAMRTHFRDEVLRRRDDTPSPMEG